MKDHPNSQKPSKFTTNLKLEGLPKPVNQLLRKNYWVIKKEKDYWHNYIKSALIKKPEKPLKKVSIKMTRYSSSCPDPDGLVSSFKYVLDGLVKAGVIVDDKYKHIGMPEYCWRKVKPKSGYIEIEIKEL